MWLTRDEVDRVVQTIQSLGLDMRNDRRQLFYAMFRFMGGIPRRDSDVAQIEDDVLRMVEHPTEGETIRLLQYLDNASALAVNRGLDVQAREVAQLRQDLQERYAAHRAATHGTGATARRTHHRPSPPVDYAALSDEAFVDLVRRRQTEWTRHRPAEPIDVIRGLLQQSTEQDPSMPKGLVRAALTRGRGVYGTESRHESTDSTVPRHIANAVCILVDAQKLRAAPHGFRLETTVFGLWYVLCPGQPFADQPMLGFGTGFLVAGDVIATAGHCLEDRDIDDVKFLFDFEVSAEGVRHDRTPAEVYHGIEVLDRVYTTDAEDYAFVRLDREVKGASPLPICDVEPQKGEKIYVVGHPLGLPKKYAGDAEVTDASPYSHFVANLDAFGGNSGSPVLDAQHRVRGILVRGRHDFVYEGDCRMMATFPLFEGGEHVCRASLWRPAIETTRGHRTHSVPERHHNPGRMAMRQALLELGPDLDFLIDYLVPDTARQHVRGLERVIVRVTALIDYYDVPHRGLDQLAALIDGAQEGP